VADPDLEVRGARGGFVLLALPAFLPALISSFFTQNKGGAPRAPPLDPPLALFLKRPDAFLPSDYNVASLAFC